MELSKQCCSKEQAVRLKELGIEQKSLFYYHTNSALAKDTAVSYYKEKGSWISFGVIRDGGAIKYYSAFTVAELGVMVCGAVAHKDYAEPEEIISKYNLKNSDKSQMDSLYNPLFLADLLIYCIEKDFTNVSDCNTRLTV